MRILVVEDEPVLREGLVDLLSSAGHSVEAVADGEAALERGSLATTQLVVLDLMLPKLDGVEVCRRLRELRPDLPILMRSARVSWSRASNRWRAARIPGGTPPSRSSSTG